MPIATIVVPAFNVAATIGETLTYLLAQTHKDFEIIVVNDGSTDSTAATVEAFCDDPRVQLINQKNRGLAGARNTGIAAARGEFIGFCDADDLWEPQKLAAHMRHLNGASHVGVSYAGSALIDDNGAFLRIQQKPRLRHVGAQHILKRNPIGNGSAAVLRRAVFDQIAFRPPQETTRDWYFDETLRQSEDLECWLRIALTTDWDFEGVDGLLTRYRVASYALSSNTDIQFTTWQQAIDKLKHLRPAFFDKHIPAARAYQYRYLARRSVSDLDGKRAADLMACSIQSSFRPFIEEPVKSCTTLAAALAMRLIPAKIGKKLFRDGALING